jgi:hypothetical protein
MTVLSDVCLAVHGPLAYSIWTRTCRLCVDACMTPSGLGVTRERVHEDGSIGVEGYASRALIKTEMKWCMSRIESLALVCVWPAYT